MPEKNYKPLLIIGILAIVIAVTSIFLLEPPGEEEPPAPSGIPEQFQTVLSPEDFASPEPTAVLTVRPAASRQASARPSASVSVRASSRRSASPGPSFTPTPSATRTPSARRSAQTTKRPAASRPAAAVQTAAERTPAATQPPEMEPTAEPEPTEAAESEPSQSRPSTAAPEPDEEPSASASGTPEAEDTQRARAAASTKPSRQKDAAARPVASVPVVPNGGLVPAVDSRFTITSDGVEEAGGMKLIEGARPNGTAILRDIRNTLLSSSSLVKAYKDGDEIGGFEPIGTGTVLELSDRSGEVVDTAVVLIRGDVDGSGVLSISQIARVAAAVEGRDPLNGVYFLAADVDDSGEVDEGDILAMSYALNRRVVNAAQGN